jgi:hypothetical protein
VVSSPLARTILAFSNGCSVSGATSIQVIGTYLRCNGSAGGQGVQQVGVAAQDAGSWFAYRRGLVATSCRLDP